MTQGTFADIAQKNDQELETLAEEDKALAALEADLRAAETRVFLAQQRYEQSAQQVAKDLATADLPSNEGNVGKPIDEAELTGTPDHEPTEKHNKGSKNAGALSDKAVNRQKWLEKRAQEGRVRQATLRARDRLRRGQRAKKFDYGGGSTDGDAAAAPAAEAKPAAEDEEKKESPVNETLAVAEKELVSAEAQLMELLAKAEALNLPEDEEYYAEARKEGYLDEESQDLAEQYEAHHQEHHESHGGKNTSQLTDKQAGCKKWEAAHNKEQRDRENDKKVRDVRREEARNRKMDAANVDDA
jgi:hypothetical protein